MKPERIPLYIGLTKPPTTFGIPVSWFAILFTLVGMGMIAFLSLKAKLLWGLGVGGVGYAFGYILTEREPFWMQILINKFVKTPPTRNRFFWKSDSYSA